MKGATSGKAWAWRVAERLADAAATDVKATPAANATDISEVLLHAYIAGRKAADRAGLHGSAHLVALYAVSNTACALALAQAIKPEDL